jgi:hypothetical protein
MLEKLLAILSDYFNIGDSYHYTLGRNKEAFGTGTMSLEDFTEYDQDTVAEIADHLIANGVTVVSPDETRNVYTVQEIEKIQGEAYDLGVESVLHNHFNLSWHDAEEVRKEVAKLQNALRWVPVTERLPKAEDANRFGEIMVWLRSTETQALWKWRRAVDHPEAITHWMPLPKPPKEVE